MDKAAGTLTGHNKQPPYVAALYSSCLGCSTPSTATKPVPFDGDPPRMMQEFFGSGRRRYPDVISALSYQAVECLLPMTMIQVTQWLGTQAVFWLCVNLSYLARRERYRKEYLSRRPQ